MLLNKHLYCILRVLVCVFAAALGSKPLSAQVDVTITVDGPWAYVADPDFPTTRIIVIAPVAPNHDEVEMSPRPSAHSSSRTIPTGKYSLDISSLMTCSGTPPTTLYSINITPSAIQKAIRWANQRYAFSVPKPCSYKEVVNNVAKASSTPIPGPASTIKGDPYTSTMELHYKVSQVTTATLTGSADKGPPQYNDSVDFKKNNIKFILSAGLLRENDEYDCDSTSAASFLATVKLFGEKRYVWLPMLNGLGEQIRDFFLDNCQKDNTRDAILKNMQTAAVGLRDIEVIEQYFANPKEHDQGVVLHALAGLSEAVESLKEANTLPRAPGTPARPDISLVREEIEGAKHLILTVESSTHEAMSQDQHAARKIGAHPLLNAYRYVAFSAAGSADCHGAQVGVNGP